MRIACAGGSVHGDESISADYAEEEPEETFTEIKNPSLETAPFKHVYTSKLHQLVDELKRIRDNEPTCKDCSALSLQSSLIFWQYLMSLLFSYNSKVSYFFTI